MTVLQKFDDVDLVDESQLPLHGGKYDIHCKLKGSERFFQSERHPYGLVKAAISSKNFFCGCVRHFRLGSNQSLRVKLEICAPLTTSRGTCLFVKIDKSL